MCRPASEAVAECLQKFSGKDSFSVTGSDAFKFIRAKSRMLGEDEITVIELLRENDLLVGIRVGYEGSSVKYLHGRMPVGAQ